MRLVGLEVLQYGAVDNTTTFLTVTDLSTIGNVVPDSAHLLVDAPSTTDLYIEEEDMPDIQILGGRKFSLQFSLRDMGTQTLLTALGGSAAAGVWRMPVTSNVITEYAFRATSKTINGKQLQVDIPRASLRAGGDLKFARTDTGVLTFTCDVLLPESSTQIPPLRICML